VIDVDDVFRRVRSGDRAAFSAWVRRVEPALRESMRRFARDADVEGVIQESLLRMWKLAPTLELTGENASLRYVYRIARNLALHEASRAGREVSLDTGGGDAFEIAAPAPAPRDHGLRTAIFDCLLRLRGSPVVALRARLAEGERPDRELASRCGMTLNTFLQNIVRARRHLASCLATHGVAVDEVLR
jgi:DNA-directed RNA polymerase specialized sigma24 family protein